MDVNSVDVLVVVSREDAGRFHKHLSAYSDFRVQLISNIGDALAALADRNQHVDVLVVDSSMGQTFEFIAELRQTYPRLFIVLVDEEADFGLPGQADEISTEPFTQDDLIRRISRLMSDRKLETLRADTLPAVRQFAKELRNASGELGKQQTAVAACKGLGYDYVAFYRLENPDPLQVTLKAQDGLTPLLNGAPRQAAADDLIGWVAQNGQSRTAGPHDSLNHPLVAAGQLGAAACVPVPLAGRRYGVLVAGREQPGSISQENVAMLELISAQLAAAISKEIVV